MKKEIVEAMLEYIYSDKIDDSDGIVVSLLIAADKYGLEHLKEICETIISNSLDNDNIVSMFTLAKMYNAKHLISTTLHYLIQHDEISTKGTYQHVLLDLCILALEELKDDVIVQEILHCRELSKILKTLPVEM